MGILGVPAACVGMIYIILTSRLLLPVGSRAVGDSDVQSTRKHEDVDEEKKLSAEELMSAHGTLPEDDILFEERKSINLDTDQGRGRTRSSSVIRESRSSISVQPGGVQLEKQFTVPVTVTKSSSLRNKSVEKSGIADLQVNEVARRR